MTRKEKEKPKTAARLFSGIFFIVGLVVLTLIGIALGREAYRKKQIQKEIESLQSQIRELNKENGELGDLIAYLSTQDFQEKEAREKLNLQKEDEQMIVLKRNVAAREEEADVQDTQDLNIPKVDSAPNWEKWWKFFFASSR